MGAQSHVEKALRELHVLLSQCEIYDAEKNRVIVDKKKMIESLCDLSQGIYELMEEHELTQSSREQAEREVKKRSEAIVLDAGKKAEDVYAASVLYTDEALKRAQHIMQNTMNSMKEIYEKMEGQMQKELLYMQQNQTELRGSLQTLRDTDKYLQIIKEHNRKRDKKCQEDKDERPVPSVMAPKPEIRMNEAYFREHGLSLGEEDRTAEETAEKLTPEVSVHLDSAYFKWKEREGDGGEIKDIRKPERKSLFGKILQ